MVEQSQLYTADLLVQNVPLRSTTTLATRLGALSTGILVGIGIGALLFTLHTPYSGGESIARSDPANQARSTPY